jgi:predicted small lipoprotein YifL
MKTVISALIGSVLAVATLTACEKGPMEKAGEKVDKAIDKLSGKGPMEKAGEKVDKAVDELKK